jgi:hypothetical protein
MEGCRIHSPALAGHSTPIRNSQPPSGHDGLASPQHTETLRVLAGRTFRGPRLRDRPSVRRVSSMPGQPCSGGTAHRTGVPRRGRGVLYLSGRRCSPATEPGCPRGPSGSGRPWRLRDREPGTTNGFHAHFLRRRQCFSSLLSLLSPWSLSSRKSAGSLQQAANRTIEPSNHRTFHHRMPYIRTLVHSSAFRSMPNRRTVVRSNSQTVLSSPLSLLS